MTTAGVTIGRGTVAAVAGRSDSGVAKQQFAHTKHSRRVLERVAVCAAMDEPVLLVGETGSGKTTSVQELADMTSRKLVVQNLSLSTDSSDLLGGFRPVTMRQLFQPSYVLFASLFRETYDVTQNADFLQVVSQLFNDQQWRRLLKAFLKASDNARGKVGAILEKQGGVDGSHSTTTVRQTGKSSGNVDRDWGALHTKWADFERRIQRFDANLSRIEHGFAFAFVDGLMVEAMRAGHWVLLDEINLASPETLQGLAGILEGQSLCLTEKGDLASVPRHPDFRLFAAMNPPTDVGKKELPSSLRCRFTEIYVAEMVDPVDLREVVSRYMHDIQEAPIEAIVEVYLGCRAQSDLSLLKTVQVNVLDTPCAA